MTSIDDMENIGYNSGMACLPGPPVDKSTGYPVRSRLPVPEG